MDQENLRDLVAMRDFHHDLGVAKNPRFIRRLCETSVIRQSQAIAFGP
jgi:hypothetical protein